MSLPSVYCLIFLLISTINPSLSARKDNPEGTSRYTYIKCRIDNSSARLKYCHLKAYSRTYVTLNIGFSIFKPIKNFLYVEVSCSYRYGNIYREVFRTPRLEWCGIMSGAASNPIISNALNTLEGNIASLVHKCPYQGEFDLQNISGHHEKDSANSMMWEGNYKTEIFIYHKEKEVLFVDVRDYIKSKLKDSFG